MRMLGIVTTFRNKVQAMLQTLPVMVLTIKAHCLKLGALRTPMIPYVDFITNQFAKIKQSISHLVAYLISQVLLIKVGLMLVLHKVGQLGQQLLITVRQILQRAYKALKRGN
jgi:hypothetical protein